MTEPLGDQPQDAAAARAPDPGAWSLGAAALMLVVMFAAQVAVLVPTVVAMLLVPPSVLVAPRTALARVAHAFSSGASVGAVTFAGYALFLLLGYLIWVRPRRRSLRQAAAWLPSRFPVWIAVPVSLATGVGLSGVVYLLREPPPEIMSQLLASPLAIAVLGFTLVTIVPVAEEVYFRGVLWAAVRRRVNAPATVLITSALFGLMHLSTYGAVASALWQTAAMGVMLAVLRARSGSIVPCVVAHAVINLYSVGTFVVFGQ